MRKNSDYIDYNEDLKILKKSMETVRKLNWNKEKKSNKSKVKNTVERNAA